MSSRVKKNKRKIVNYLLNKPFQFAFILRIWAVVIVSAAAIAFAVYLANKIDVGNTASMSELAMDVSSAAAKKFAGTVISVLLVGGTILLLTFFIFVVISHQLAGPIYRFTRILERMHEKDLTMRAHLRKGDEFAHVGRMFNETQGKMCRDFEHIGGHLRRLEQTVGKVKGKTEQEKLTAEVNAIRKVVNSYLISDPRDKRRPL